MYSDKQIKDIFFDLEKSPNLFDFQFRGFSMYFMVRFFFEMQVRNSVVPKPDNKQKQEDNQVVTPITNKKYSTKLAKLAYKYPKNLLSKLIIAIDWRLARRKEQKNSLLDTKEKSIAYKKLIQHFDTNKDIPKTPFLFVSTSGLMTKDNVSMEMPDIMQYFHEKRYPIVFLQGYFGIKTRKMPFYDKFILLEDNNNEVGKITEVEKIQLNQFVSFLRQYFNLPFENFENIFEGIFLHQYSKAINLLWYIQQTQCKYVFARSIYSDPWVIMACKLANVNCVEVQHGPMYVDLIYYQSALPIAKLGQNTIILPNYMITTGEVWKDVFIEQGYIYTEHTILNLGHHEYEQVIKNTANQQVNYVQSKEFTILVAGQAGIFNISQEISNFIEKYKKELTEANIKIIIRPHPLHIDETVNKLQEQYAAILTLQKPQTINIYEALQSTDVVISAASTCLYEAIAMGKAAISFKKFEGQLLAKDILLVDTIDELWNLLKKIKNKEIKITPKPYISPLNTKVLDIFCQ